MKSGVLYDIITKYLNNLMIIYQIKNVNQSKRPIKKTT